MHKTGQKSITKAPHQYLYIPEWSNQVLILTNQSNQGFLLALDFDWSVWKGGTPINVCDEGPLLIYECITILCPVQQLCTNKFTRWSYSKSGPPLHINTHTPESDYWPFSCAMQLTWSFAVSRNVFGFCFSTRITKIRLELK